MCAEADGDRELGGDLVQIVPGGQATVREPPVGEEAALADQPSPSLFPQVAVGMELAEKIVDGGARRGVAVDRAPQGGGTHFQMDVRVHEAGQQRPVAVVGQGDVRGPLPGAFGDGDDPAVADVHMTIHDPAAGVHREDPGRPEDGLVGRAAGGGDTWCHSRFPMVLVADMYSDSPSAAFSRP